MLSEGEEKTVIGNLYCRRFRDAWDAASYAAAHLGDLEKTSREFVDSLKATTLPEVVVEAALSNLSTVKTNTVFQTPARALSCLRRVQDQRLLFWKLHPRVELRVDAPSPLPFPTPFISRHLAGDLHGRTRPHGFPLLPALGKDAFRIRGGGRTDGCFTEALS